MRVSELVCVLHITISYYRAWCGGRTCSRKCSDKLMYRPSRWVTWLLEPLLRYTRSEPARSTRCSCRHGQISSVLDGGGCVLQSAIHCLTLDTVLISVSRCVHWRVRVKMQCDREEASFIGVSLVTRFTLPRNSRFNASSSQLASYTFRLRRCRSPARREG